MDKDQLTKFAEWVAATARLFEDQLAPPLADTAMHFVMSAMVKRGQAHRMRRSTDPWDWSLAALSEAEGRSSVVGSVFYAGMESFFREDPFDLKEYRFVRARVEEVLGA